LTALTLTTLISVGATGFAAAFAGAGLAAATAAVFFGAVLLAMVLLGLVLRAIVLAAATAVRALAEAEFFAALRFAAGRFAAARVLLALLVLLAGRTALLAALLTVFLVARDALALAVTLLAADLALPLLARVADLRLAWAALEGAFALAVLTATLAFRAFVADAPRDLAETAALRLRAVFFADGIRGTLPGCPALETGQASRSGPRTTRRLRRTSAGFG